MYIANYNQKETKVFVCDTVQTDRKGMLTNFRDAKYVEFVDK